MESTEGDIVLLFHFRPNINVKTETLRTMLWTLIEQLVNHSRATKSAKFQDQLGHLRRLLRWKPCETPLQRLWDLLGAMLETQSRFTIIVDGLDECKFVLSAGLETPKGVVQQLEQLSKADAGRVAVLSRPLWNLRRLSSKSIPILDISPSLLRRDIETFLSSLYRIHKLPPELFHSVLRQVQAKAEGSFQWVMLYAKHLADAPTLTRLRERITSFPATLYKAYERILYDQDEWLDNDEKEQRTEIFLAVLVTRRTLTLDEITSSHDMPSSKSIDIILRLCSPFVEVQDDNLVVFSHSSVKDFFLSPGQGRYHLTLDDANYLQAKKALQRLLQPALADLDFIVTYLRKNNGLPADSGDPESTLPPDNDNLNYSALYWVDHLVAAETRQVSLVKLAANFLASNQFVSYAEYITSFNGTKEPVLVAERKLRKWLNTLPPDLASLLDMNTFTVAPYHKVSNEFSAAAILKPLVSCSCSGTDANTTPTTPELYRWLTLQGLYDYFYEKGDTQALELIKRVAAGMVNILGPDHRLSLVARSKEAASTLWEGDIRRAAELFESLASSQQRVIGEKFSDMWQSIVYLARAKFLMGNLDGAWEDYIQALAGLEPLMGKENAFYIGALAMKAEILIQRGLFFEGASQLQKLYEKRVEREGVEDGAAIWIQARLGEAYLRLGEYKMALENLRTCYEHRQHQSGDPGNFVRVDPAIALVIAYRQAGKGKEASDLLKTVKGTFSKEKLPQRWCQVAHLEGLIRVDEGDVKRGTEILRKFVVEVHRDEYNRAFMWLLLDLAFLLRRSGRDDEAVCLFEDIIVETEDKNPELHDEPNPPERLKLAEEALYMVRKGNTDEAANFLRSNGLFWTRERDIWWWEGGSAADTGPMRGPLSSK